MDKHHLEILTKVLKEIYKENGLPVCNLTQSFSAKLKREGLLS